MANIAEVLDMDDKSLQPTSETPVQSHVSPEVPTSNNNISQSSQESNSNIGPSPVVDALVSDSSPSSIPTEGFTSEEVPGYNIASADDKLNQAVELANKGVPPSIIFNVTGYTIAYNGDIRDANGNTVRRGNNENPERNTGHNAEGETSGQFEEAVSGNDGRGVSEQPRVENRHDLQRGWDELSDSERQSTTEIILEHIENNPNDLTELLLNDAPFLEYRSSITFCVFSDNSHKI